MTGPSGSRRPPRVQGFRGVEAATLRAPSPETRWWSSRPHPSRRMRSSRCASARHHATPWSAGCGTGLPASRAAAGGAGGLSPARGAPNTGRRHSRSPCSRRARSTPLPRLDAGLQALRECPRATVCRMPDSSGWRHAKPHQLLGRLLADRDHRSARKGCQQQPERRAAVGELCVSRRPIRARVTTVVRAHRQCVPHHHSLRDI